MKNVTTEAVNVAKQEQTDWRAVREILTSYPMIEPRLRKLERIAGDTPVHLWLAAALFDFVEWNDEDNRQATLIHMICSHANQKCELNV